MILFVNNNLGILFLSGIEAAGQFIKITYLTIFEYIKQHIDSEDSYD